MSSETETTCVTAACGFSTLKSAQWMSVVALPERSRPARVAVALCNRDGEWVLSGLRGLVVMKTTGSEFHGFIEDRYTTLKETRDRILATAPPGYGLLLRLLTRRYDKSGQLAFRHLR